MKLISVLYFLEGNAVRPLTSGMFLVPEVTEEALSSIELVPSGARDDLALVAAWLDQHSASDKLTVYAKIRSQTMMQSLQVSRDMMQSLQASRHMTQLLQVRRHTMQSLQVERWRHMMKVTAGQS